MFVTEDIQEWCFWAPNNRYTMLDDSKMKTGYLQKTGQAQEQLSSTTTTLHEG